MRDIYEILIGNVGDRIEYGEGDLRNGWEDVG